MANIEAEVIAYLRECGFDAFGVVPSERPSSFVTLERTGGGIKPYREDALLAVQSWAPTKLAASEQAHDIAEALERMPHDTDFAACVEVENVYSFPDPDSSQPRYQLTVNIISC